MSMSERLPPKAYARNYISGIVMLSTKTYAANEMQ